MTSQAQRDSVRTAARASARARAERAQPNARKLAAELAILHRFDLKRRTLGHDYGAGQRARELARRGRELDRLAGNLGYTSLALVAAGVDLPASMTRGMVALTARELDAAFDRVAVPRVKRLRREDYRSSTSATRRTVAAWDSVLAGLAVELGRELAR